MDKPPEYRFPIIERKKPASVAYSPNDQDYRVGDKVRIGDTVYEVGPGRNLIRVKKL